MKCTEKRHYLSRAAAELGAKRNSELRASHGETHRKLHPYKCDQCGLWHLSTWSPQKHEAVFKVHQAARQARVTTKLAATPEPPTTKALRTHLVQITAAIKLDEKRQDAARLKRAEAVGKLVEADLALIKAEDEYRAAQEAVLKQLGVSQ